MKTFRDGKYYQERGTPLQERVTGHTIPVRHEIDPYVGLLAPNGTLVLLGAVEPLPGLNGFNLIFSNRVVAGSLIGGLPETQEMLDFCADHAIVRTFT